MQCFTRSKRVYMFLSTFDVSLGQSAYFIFCFSLWPFLESVGEVDAPCVCFLPRLARSASDHYYYFYKVSLNTLDLLFFCIIIPFWSVQLFYCFAPILRVLLILMSGLFRRRLRSFRRIFDHASNVFQQGYPEMSENFLDLSERAGFVCPFRSLWGFSAIVDGLYGHRTLIWHRFILGGLAYPSVTYDERGVQNSQKDWFAPYLGVFSLSYFFLVSLQRRYQRAFGHPKGPQLSWGFYKVLRRTAPRMRAKSWEVCTFPSVFLVTLQRRSQWDVSLISKRNCFKPYFLKFCEEERIK